MVGADGRDVRWQHLADTWIRPAGTRRLLAVSVIMAMVAAVGWLVYVTGGIKYVYSHAMYMPVVLAGVVFGARGGVLAGIAGGLVLGPDMPLVVATGEMQLPFQWLYRMAFFVSVGAIVGMAVTAAVARTERLRWLAFHDESTGLPNAASLEQRIDGRTAAGDGFHLITLASVDLEEIGSTFGHAAEEAVIRSVHSRLRETLPPDSEVFRYRPERLAVLVSSSDSARSYCQSITRALRAPFEFDGLPLHMASSMGSISCPDYEGPAAGLIQKADMALRHARETGSARAFYEPHIDRASRENLALMGMLALAIGRGQLRLHYQPKVDLATNHAVGAEALLRWEHPERGMILPGHFIPQSERTDLITALTQWVLSTALGSLRQWNDQGMQAAIAVNISTRNLQEPDFAERIDALVADFGIDHESLELEITESAVMCQPELAIKRLERLKDRRIVLSIDDFGTGYSSLSYLSRLPIAAIKIDQSFVANVNRDDGIKSIVGAAASMGHSLGLKVIAEGIESEQALQTVRELGCDIGQGFHICRPIPETDLLPWFRASPWPLPAV